MLGLLGLLQFSPMASAYKDTETLGSGGYKEYDITGLSDSSEYLDFEVEVQGDNEIDIYILNNTEYSKYVNDDYFEPVKLYERTLDRNFTWAQRDPGAHYLVIDNQDNARRDDAHPSGTLTYMMQYNVEDYKDGDRGLLYMYMFLIACFAIIFIVIVLVLVKGTGFLVGKIRGRHDEPDPSTSSVPTQVGGGQWKGTHASSTSQHPPPPPSPPTSTTPHSGYRPTEPAERRPAERRSEALVPERHHDSHPPDSPAGPSVKLPRPVAVSGERVGGVQSDDSPASPELCPDCTNPIKPGWKVCPNCSGTLETEKPPEPDVCHECGQTLEAEWKVCPKCTSPVEEPGPTLCPKCENEVEADWKACPICASPLD